DREVVAPRPREAGDVPGVEDAGRLRGKEHQADVGGPVWQDAWRAVDQDTGPAHEPGAMLATAREGPATAHPVAAIDGDGRPRGREGAAADGVAIRVDLPCGVIR